MKICRSMRIMLLSVWIVSLCIPAAFGQGAVKKCDPTPPDMLGPFYEPDAPDRSSVGKGYLLTGTVRSSADCSPIVKALIEFWLTGPDGQYGDNYRATMFSDKSGTYRFESNAPKPYFNRPPHIHIRVSADGYRTLITQHYPALNTTKADFDLVLIPKK